MSRNNQADNSSSFGMIKNKKTKLLFVGAFPPPGSKIVGGQVRACQTLVRSSFSDRFSLVLVDTTQISNPPPRLIKRAILALKRFLTFIYKLYREQPDAVLLFSAVGLSLLEKGAMARVAEFFGIPAVHFPRGAEIIDVFHQKSIHRPWIRWVFSGPTFNCAQGPAWQRFFTKELGLEKTRSPIIFNWTAVPELIKLGEERMGCDTLATGEMVRVLFMGWLEREKGVFELLHACRRLQTSANFHLTFAGSGHAESEAEEYVDEHGLASMVSFAGWVHGDDLHGLLADSDVLVLPSWAEGFPNAVIEAMAAGLAVVTTTVGTIPDVLTDGREALLVPPRNIDALRDALSRVIVDDTLRTNLQQRGHEFASINFTLEPAVDNLSKVINDAVFLHKKLGATV